MLLSAIALSLLVQEPTGPHVDCATAVTTLDLNACAAEDAGAEDARMRAYLAAALERQIGDTPAQTSAMIAALNAGQLAWEAYVRSACDAVYIYWQGGSIRAQQALLCRERLTQERSLFLWREYLTYPDSTPPILPRPLPLVSRSQW